MGDPEYDKNAAAAMSLHYRYLFRSASQHCVGFVAKGVFLIGDNQVGFTLDWVMLKQCVKVSNDAFVCKHVEEFKEEFLNHSKRSWIEDVEVFRQIKSYNLMLLGCLFMAKHME
jgi:hypothetical protein